MDAARVMLRMRQKLDGYEGGDLRSVEGQVRPCTGTLSEGAEHAALFASERGALQRRPLCMSLQVQHLIQQARDPDNLSQMFVGWAAWN